MNRSKVPAAVGLLAAGVIAGGVVASTVSASAADNGNSTGSSSTSSSTPAAAATPPANNFSSTPVRNDESSVSASLAATLKQKAEAKTGGTVYRVETDSGDAAYEAHVKKSDGTLVTVKFDKNGNITAVEAGMGK
jgi:hypothetical protein